MRWSKVVIGALWGACVATFAILLACVGMAVATDNGPVPHYAFVLMGVWTLVCMVVGALVAVDD